MNTLTSHLKMYSSSSCMNIINISCAEIRGPWGTPRISFTKAGSKVDLQISCKGCKSRGQSGSSASSVCDQESVASYATAVSAGGKTTGTSTAVRMNNSSCQCSNKDYLNSISRRVHIQSHDVLVF